LRVEFNEPPTWFHQSLVSSGPNAHETNSIPFVVAKATFSRTPTPTTQTGYPTVVVPKTKNRRVIDGTTDA
jgi:hypothetical protein